MSLVNRIARGLIFEDRFSTTRLNPMWQASPSDGGRYSLTERPGYLRLKHGSPDLFMLLNAPYFDHVLEAEIDYAPTKPSDQGGLVAYTTLDDRIEMLEYFDVNQGGNWNKVRFRRTGDLLEGYGSNDNGATWQLVGVSVSTARKIGLVLHGVNESGSVPMDVKSVKLYKSTKISFTNLQEGYSVKMYSTNHTLLGEATVEEGLDFANIDAENISFPLNAYFRIFDDAGYEFTTTDTYDDVWGGDVFAYGIRIDVEIDGNVIRSDREYKLGNLQGGVIEKKFYLVNNTGRTIHNLVVSVASYNEYKGWEWAEVALENFGEPGLYSKSVNVYNLNILERYGLWMRIRKNTDETSLAKEHKFRILIESR